MFFAEAFFGVGSKPQLLALSQLDDEDVCKESYESAKGWAERSDLNMGPQCLGR